MQVLQTRFVLHDLITEFIFIQVKDNMRLLGVVKSAALLLSRLGVGGSTSAWIIEEFTSQMRAVSKIALHRRANLAAFLEMNGMWVVL